MLPMYIHTYGMRTVFAHKNRFPFLVWKLCDSKGFLLSPPQPPPSYTKILITCSKMSNFWTLSAIAAFCLGEVLSVNFGGALNGQSGAVPSWGGSGGLDVPAMPNRGGLRPSSNPDILLPHIQFGDDKIRIACITLFCRHFLLVISSRRLIKNIVFHLFLHPGQ